MEQNNKYEAIGQFIYGFHRLQTLVDHLLGQLQVSIPLRATLSEKLLCLDGALEQVGDAHSRTAIDAFLQQMRLMEGMNVPLNDFADMQDDESDRYAQQARLGHELAEAVRVSVPWPAPGGATQAPPA